MTWSAMVSDVFVAQVDLVLRRGHFVVGVFHLDAHGVQSVDRVAAQVAAGVERGEVEVATVVEHLGAAAVLEVEELELGAARTWCSPGPRLLATTLRSTLRGSPVERIAVGLLDVAEHAGGAAGAGAPGEQGEGAGIGIGDHVGFLDAGEAVDRGTVEAHALFEGAFEFGRGDGEALEGAEHIGEPEPDELDLLVLNDLEDILLRSVSCLPSALPFCCSLLTVLF